MDFHLLDSVFNEAGITETKSKRYWMMDQRDRPSFPASSLEHDRRNRVWKREAELAESNACPLKSLSYLERNLAISNTESPQLRDFLNKAGVGQLEKVFVQHLGPCNPGEITLDSLDTEIYQNIIIL
ncbi:unnamed protein product [Protopolystoma xenopodis]|uniref:Uncharacterized protein n=1 Tax=Protopolystoma xenopodis TaxID=117903 RepID=A0A3S5CLS3_9PLAT|nr:unnamed protein product [Protopolystoma xenopodis]